MFLSNWITSYDVTRSEKATARENGDMRAARYSFRLWEQDRLVDESGIMRAQLFCSSKIRFGLGLPFEMTDWLSIYLSQMSRNDLWVNMYTTKHLDVHFPAIAAGHGELSGGGHSGNKART